MNAPQAYRECWQRKPVLRAVYSDIFVRIAQRMRPGTTLEIGGGSGNLKDNIQAVTSMDIQPADWLDVAGDAQMLPFADRMFDNIVMVDVLHHVEWPVQFFREAIRVLRPMGRIVMCEPAITPVSGVFYRFFHPEPVDMLADPLRDGPVSRGRDPFEANQAIPTLLTGRCRAEFHAAFGCLRLIDLQRFSFLTYPLSGGFRRWSAVPTWLVVPMLRVEWALRGLLGKFAAFRLIAVYERGSERSD